MDRPPAPWRPSGSAGRADAGTILEALVMSTTRSWKGRVFVGVSLDGYIARSDSDLDWLEDPRPEVPHREVTSSAHALEWDSFFPHVDHLLMGRGTYEKVLTFGGWPYSGKSVLVLSSTLPADDPRVTVLRTLDDATRHLAEEKARDVYIDGGKVIQSCLAADLVDEITVGIAPVLIGAGIPLFGALPGDVRLRLQGTHATGGGMVHVTYAVHREA
jgi:dihydrofolate reductase